MKKISFLAICFITLMISCKKPNKNDQVTPLAPASLVVAANADSSMAVVVNYSSTNTTSYYDDIVKVYYSDTFANNTTIDPHLPNTSFAFTFKSPKYLGGKWRVDLVRETTPGVKSVIATVSGN